MNKPTFFATLFALLVGAGAIAIGQAQTAQGAQNAPKVVVGKQLTAKANTPTPGKTAKNPTQKSSIGKGATSVKASQPSSFWVEDLDVDDDGVVETSDYLYDAQRGLLYTYREDDFACPNGKPESGSILMASVREGEQGTPAGGFRLVHGESQYRTMCC